MLKRVALKAKDWIIFREYGEKRVDGGSCQFSWRIGRVARVVDDDSVEIFLCAPEVSREIKRGGIEGEPWNTSGIALPEFPAEYLIAIHLRNRKSIAWLSESRSRRVKRADVVLANNVADAELVLASTQNRF